MVDDLTLGQLAKNMKIQVYNPEPLMAQLESEAKQRVIARFLQMQLDNKRLIEENKMLRAALEGQ